MTLGELTCQSISNKETHAMHATQSQIMSHAQAAEQSCLLRLRKRSTRHNTLVHQEQPPCLTLQVFEATGRQSQQGR